MLKGVHFQLELSLYADTLLSALKLHANSGSSCGVLMKLRHQADVVQRKARLKKLTGVAALIVAVFGRGTSSGASNRFCLNLI